MDNNFHPVVISFLDIHDKLVTTPIWTQYDSAYNKFFFFSSAKSMKVRSIEQGNTQFTVTIVNRDAFVVVNEKDIPYISMNGSMRIVTQDEVPNLHKIHLKLLQKYTTPEQKQWVFDLIEKINENPESIWMLEFTPEKIRFYSE